MPPLMPIIAFAMIRHADIFAIARAGYLLPMLILSEEATSASDAATRRASMPLQDIAMSTLC